MFATPRNIRVRSHTPHRPHTMSIDFDGLFRSAPPLRPAPGLSHAFPTVLAGTPIGELHCATTTIDPRGRLGDRSSIRILEWEPGQPVSIVADDCVAVVRRANSSRWSVARKGYLHLPARVRHDCHLDPGDRVLVAAAPLRAVLVVFPTSAVAGALWAYRPQLWRAP
jgi:hypothetical protein